MDEIVEVLDDTSSSDKTVILEQDEINVALKEQPPNTASSSQQLHTKFYDMDSFSDEEFIMEPLEVRLHKLKKRTKDSRAKWQDQFDPGDFCENSKDLDELFSIVNMDFQGKEIENSNLNMSLEVENLINGTFRNVNAVECKSFSHTETSDSSGNLDDKGFASGGNDHVFEEKTETQESQPATKKIKKASDIAKDKVQKDKELAKTIKAQEKEQKRLEKENEKRLKNALKVVQNSVKPDQCLQYITVNIDTDIADNDYGRVIKAGLQGASYNYKVAKQVLPNVISWTRKVHTVQNFALQNDYKQLGQYLLIMPIGQLINLVASDNFTSHIQSLLALTHVEHLTVALLELQQYYKYLKQEKNEALRAAVADSALRHRSNNRFSSVPKISKNQIENKLIEAQMYCKNLYIRPVDKLEDLASFVAECTKTVAKIPFKLAKADSFQQENEFFLANNRDCVPVDKNGNGLGRLWNQWLRMFPLASLETAEAITALYPTVDSLVEAYRKCGEGEGEKLLQDLPVRRAAGPLSGQRRLGPELSKKIYKFFTSTENVLL